MVLCLFLKLNCHKFLFLRKLENLFSSPFSGFFTTNEQTDIRSSRRRCSIWKGALRSFEKFTRKHPCQGLCNFIKKETLAQVFSCEFCKISKNTFFAEHAWATASWQIIVMILSVILWWSFLEDMYLLLTY